MKLKISPKLIACIYALAIVTLLAGCLATGPVANHQQDNPNDTPVTIDEDGDGIAEAIGILDPETGKPKIDPETNKPIEIEGTRESFNKAKGIDSSLATFIALAGFPGAAGLGKLWGTLKPAARANDLAVKFQGVVKSVQAVRKNPDLAGVVDVIDETLKASQAGIEGLQPAIAQAKEVIEAEKTEKAA